MNSLPKSAGLASYVVVTTVMCTITYVVFYLRDLQNAILQGRISVHRLWHIWKNDDSKQWMDKFKLASSTPKRASTIA